MTNFRFFLKNAATIVACFALVCFFFSGCEKCPECEKNDLGPSVPGVVENLTVTTGDGQVGLTWGIPLDDGGSAITGYELTKDNWATKETKTESERSHTFTGLSAGSHTFKVRAVNARGAGAAGVAVTVFTVKEVEVEPGPTVPGAVENLTVTVGVGEVSLAWEAPSDNGGSAITGYELTMDDWANKVTKTASQLSHTFPGLVAGVQYTFKLRAVNAQGEGVTGIAVTVVTECNCEPEEPADGVLINGVVWSAYNVDAPGTFVTEPENFGMFYQWNRRIGWSTSNPITSSPSGNSWNASEQEGTTWAKANDPSPEGWRVPTFTEVERLLDDSKVTIEWTEQNGVKGNKFTDKTNGNSIFLPAAGWRTGSSSTPEQATTDGQYWSSSTNYANDGVYASRFNFNTGNPRMWSHTCYRSTGISVRPVKE